MTCERRYMAVYHSHKKFLPEALLPEKLDC